MILSLQKGLLLLIIFTIATCVFDISEFGAVPNSDIVSDQFKNQRAIEAAIYAANQSET